METKMIFHSQPNSPTGKRATIVGIVDDNKTRIDIGVALCSEKDNFQRKLGRIIAERRARNLKSRYISLNVAQRDWKQDFYNFSSELSKTLCSK